MRAPAPTARREGSRTTARNRPGCSKPNSTCFSALVQLDQYRQHLGERYWQMRRQGLWLVVHKYMNDNYMLSLLKCRSPLAYSRGMLESESPSQKLEFNPKKKKRTGDVNHFETMKNEVIHSGLELDFWQTRCSHQAPGLRARKLMNSHLPHSGGKHANSAVLLHRPGITRTPA